MYGMFSEQDPLCVVVVVLVIVLRISRYYYYLTVGVLDSGSIQY
jgi:hypothetical protein